MSVFLPAINQILSLSSLAGQVIVVALFLLLLFKKDSGTLKFVGEHAPLLLFLVALAGMVASLFYSDVVGFAPCTLCWYERIMLYPEVLLAGLMLFGSDKESRKKGMFDAILIFSIIGAVISAYHQYLQFGGVAFVPCSATGPSCAARYVFEFGYITIPMMALTSFLLNIMFVLLGKRTARNLP